MGIIFSSAFAQSREIYRFTRPTVDTKVDIPRYQKVGDLALANNLKVAAYSLTLPSGGGSDWETLTPSSLHSKLTIKPELVPQLNAYSLGTDAWLLAPKGWSPFRGGIGANGSMFVVIASDKTMQSFVSYYNTSACVGCALSSASVYFDEAKKLAKKDDFYFYTATEPTLKKVKLGKNQVAYNVVLNEGNPIDGLAYFDPHADYPFWDVRVSLPQQDKQLATAILNTWVIPRSVRSK